MHQCIVSIASDPSEPSIRAVSNDVMAEEGISVPTILLLSWSFSRTTWIFKKRIKILGFKDLYSQIYNISSFYHHRMKKFQLTCIFVLDPLRAPSCVRTDSTWFQTLSTEPARTLYVFFRNPTSHCIPKFLVLQLPLLY